MGRGHVFSDWVAKNAPLLIRCGVLSETDEPGELTAREQTFVRLMNDHIKANEYGAVTPATLDRAFRELQDLGLIAQPQEPEAEPEPTYTLRVRPRGAATKTLGPFTGEEAQRRAKQAIADRMTAIEILDQDGQPVDFDLNPIVEGAEREAETLTDTGASLKGMRAEKENPKPKSERFVVALNGNYVTEVGPDWSLQYDRSPKRAKVFDREPARQVAEKLRAKDLGRVEIHRAV